MGVRRTIPQRARSLVGAGCFCDHYGPDDVSRSAGMQVPPHPHIGLQTVSWLFDGEVVHRDSVGSLVTVRPGELNLMTAGVGISHSEESPAAGRPPVLHGVQLWTVLPEAHAGVAPHFEHHGDLPVVEHAGARVQVFMGSLTIAGRRLVSPARTYSPLVGAQLDLPPGRRLELEVDPAFEHALLVDTGDVTLAGDGAAGTVPPATLGYVAPGPDRLVVTAGDGAARAVLIGGEPFEEDVVMWWNFVGRSHDEIVEFRREWEAESERFGAVTGYQGSTRRLPAPPLPKARLKPRRNP
jgi:redox-sensitive bicupin YhaK (pirin superfamily)